MSSPTLRRVTDLSTGEFYNPGMVKRRPRHFIREWRKHRGLTQEQLAERMGVARSYISHIENGKRRYDQPFLEAAADALRTSPGDLLQRDPLQEDPLWPIWQEVPPEAKPVVLNMIRGAVKKTGTDG